MPFGPWNTQQNFEPNLNPPHFFAEVNNDIGKVLWKKNKRKEIEISFLLKKKSNKFFCRQRDQTNLTVRLISKDSFNASSVVWLIEITQERGKMDRLSTENIFFYLNFILPTQTTMLSDMSLLKSKSLQNQKWFKIEKFQVFFDTKISDFRCNLSRE